MGHTEPTMMHICLLITAYLPKEKISSEVFIEFLCGVSLMNVEFLRGGSVSGCEETPVTT